MMNTSGFRKLTLFALLLSWTVVGWSQSPVWKVEKDGSTVYLGGTIHMLKPSDYPLPDAFSLAYSASQRLVFETDIGAVNSSEGQAKLLALMMSKPGETLSSTLSPSVYQEFAQALEQRGMHIRMVEPFKVGMAVVTLQVAEFMRMGLSLEGVDKFYYNMATQDQLSLGFL